MNFILQCALMTYIYLCGASGIVRFSLNQFGQTSFGKHNRVWCGENATKGKLFRYSDNNNPDKLVQIS